MALFAGCSTGGEPAGGDDPRAVAEPVPVVAAQALTLRFGLGSEVGLQEVGEQEAASLLVEDVDGYPLVYLTVLGPEAKGSFWEAARAAVAAGEGHYLVATGASTLYSPTLFADTGTDTLEHLLSVVDEMGGPEALARVVGFNDPGRFFLVDREGRYRDGYTGEAVSEDEVAQLAQVFHETVERLAEEDDYRAEMELVWRCLLGEASEEECQAEDASAEALEAREAEAALLSRLGYDPVSVQQFESQPQAEGMDLAAMTGADGELDFGKAQEVIEKGGAANFANHQDAAPLWKPDKPKCAGWFCFGKLWALEARDKRTDQPEYKYIGQNWQRTSDYDFDPREPDATLDHFTLYRLDGNGEVGGRPLGCGPAAFIRLATWYRFERQGYTGQPNIDWYGDGVSVSYGTGDYTGVGAEMFERTKWLGHKMLAMRRVQIGSGSSAKVFYRPYLADKMRTKAFAGQGLTLPSGFMNGANYWLIEKTNSNLRLWGGGYVFVLKLLPPIGWLAWNTEVWKMYSIGMRVVGAKDEPVIALYPVPGGYHFSPVLEVKLWNYRVKAAAMVRIPENEWVSSGGKFVNISAFLRGAGGLYGLQ